MQSEYIRAEYTVVQLGEYEGEIVVEDPDNTDGGNGVVKLDVKDFDSGESFASVQLNREQFAQLLTALQARA